MNKIYKVIFCKATQTFIAVSEFAKGLGKGSVRGILPTARQSINDSFSLVFSGRLKALSLAVLIGLGMLTHSTSAEVYINNNTDGKCARSNGGNSTTGSETFENYGNSNSNSTNQDDMCKPSNNATAANAANAQTNRILFWDENSTTNASFGGDIYVNNGKLNMGSANSDSIAIGNPSAATNATSAAGNEAVSIGHHAIANGSQAVALGSGANATSQSVALGNDTTAAGNGSVALGGDDSGGTSDGGYSENDILKTRGIVRTSKKWRQTTTYGVGSTAISVHSQALSKGSTAIGIGATAGDGEVSTSGTWSNATQNIEATAIGALSHASAEHSTAVGANSEAKGVNSASFGYNSYSSAANAVAIGTEAQATGVDGYALGKGSRARGENSVALGTGSEAGATTGYKEETIAIGNKSKSYGRQSITIGSDLTTSGHYGIAIGSNLSNSTAKTDSTGYAGVAIGSGGSGNKKGAMANGASSVAIGGGNNTLDVNGALASGNYSLALGSGSSAELADSIALGSQSLANTALGQVGYDISGTDHSADTSGIWKSTAAAVSVGNVDATTKITRQITDVAAGTADTDAVNVAQLKTVATVANKGFSIAGASTTVSGKDATIQPAETLTIIGNATNNTFSQSDEGANIFTQVTDDNTISIALAKNITKINSVTLANTTNTAQTTTLTSNSDGHLDVGGDKITNIAAGTISATSKDAINGSQLYATGNSIAGLIGGSTTKINTNGSVTFGDAANKGIGDTRETTIHDAIKSINTTATTANQGFNVKERGKTKGTVTPTESINFVDGTLTTANVTDEANGVTNITFDVNAQNIVQTAQLPVVYTKDGTKVYKRGNKFYDDPTAGNEVAATGVMASMQNANGSTTTATQLSNIASTLPSTYSAATGGNTITASQALPTTLTTAQYSNAATVGDVLNSGWNLQAGSKALDFVKAYDTVNFKAGSGITISSDTNGSTNNITYSLNYDTNVFKLDSDGKLTLKGSTLAVTNTTTSVTATNSSTTTTGGGTGGHLTVEAGKNINATLDTSNNTNTLRLSTANTVNFDNTSINKGLTVSNGATVSMGNNVVSDVSSGLVDSQGNTVTLANATGDTLKNAANIGDLKAVQNTVSTVSTIVGNSSNTADDQKALTTYSPNDQTQKTDNTVLSAIQNMNEGGIKYFHTNDTSNNYTTTSTNGEDSQASGAYSTAIGYQAVSGGTNALAIGVGAQATGDNSISVGTGNKVSGDNSGAFGDPTVVTGDSAYSIGNNNTISSSNTYALGSNITQTVANSVFLGDNASSTGAHTKSNYGTNGNYTYAGANDANVSGVNDVVGVVSVGTSGGTRQIQNVSAGVVSADSTDAINGSQLYWTNQAVATNATAITNNAIAIWTNIGNIQTNTSNIAANAAEIAKGVNFTSDSGTTVNRQLGDAVNISGGSNITTKTTDSGVQVSLNDDVNINKLTVGDTVTIDNSGINAGNTQIANVADGELSAASTYAVNGSQLYATNQNVASNTDNINKLFDGLNDVNNAVKQLDKETKAGIAGSAAIGMLGQPHQAGDSAISAGIATHEGQGAFALGASAISDNGKWMLKGAVVQDTANQTTVAGSVTYSW